MGEFKLTWSRAPSGQPRHSWFLVGILIKKNIACFTLYE